ncbi:hypothetical protein BDV25DRAFT_151622 [Aspergillus avenaceus]|uniref:Xylanolytic transcriptional activator xlnR n=1 Tax=Aspergillus avenaceus TaxID=36643 RepID=A0A5N6U0H7_ASPAV|nr:hypothetical protein BDV25DRAFT_151622 [Aspergillus avenaceus]
MSGLPEASLEIESNCEGPDRVRRACDRCNMSRTRCSGEIPCRRCLKLNHACGYQRTEKKRGPKPRSARPISAPGLHCDTPGLQAFSSRESKISRDSDADSRSAWKEVVPSPASTAPDSHPNFGALVPSASFNQTLSSDRVTQCWLGALDYGCIPIDLSPFVAGYHGESDTTCRYPCLKPILPLLTGTITPRAACDLLDVFFASDDGIGPRCPYVPSPVIRRKSLLCSSNPRPVSPALLAIILWCVSHTPNLYIFQDANTHHRVTQRLYFLSMDLLGASDSDKPESKVDNVLSFVLLACVISACEFFKEECLGWWSKAVLLVKRFGFNSEARITEHVPLSQQMSLAAREKHEEQRRAFWLVYALDRHLALYFHKPLQINDSECQVLNPLPEWLWQNLDTIRVEDLPLRICGPYTCISGTGFFECFLPLMVILGNIIDLRSRVQRPRLENTDEACLIKSIEASLLNCEYSVQNMRLVNEHTEITISGLTSPSIPSSSTVGDSNRQTTCPTEHQMNLVALYSQYMIRVMHILLYGKWDPISLGNGGWLASPEFDMHTSNSLIIRGLLGQILQMDKDLSFMPFLFGIYLFHGSMTFLVLADRAAQTGLSPLVQEACEMVLRANEISTMAFNTVFQRKLCRALRVTLYKAQN